MIKRVIVFNNLALLQPNTMEQYYDYFMFIESPFKKTFYSMLDNPSIPIANATIEERMNYFIGEADKIIDALNLGHFHSDDFINFLTNEVNRNILKNVMALYLTNYEHDGRTSKREFQNTYFLAIKNWIFDNKDIIMANFPDEYKFVSQYLIRKMLQYYTTDDPIRDLRYLCGDVNNALTFVLETDEWYLNYELHAFDSLQDQNVIE